RGRLFRGFGSLGRSAFGAGGPIVTVKKHLADGQIVIDVADNGPGVPQEVADQIFRPFTTSGRAGGAGLGLAIARDLVCAHGGDISLSETSAQGTTFRFTLPAHGTRA